jgi:adenylylsulfate kinase
MPESKNIVWSQGHVTVEKRESAMKQKGCVVWFTGLSGSGKSAVANKLEKRLFDLGRVVYVLDGDNIRYGLCSDLGFSDFDRKENIRRISEVSALFANAGIITLTAFISPFRRDRLKARKKLPEGRFVEVFTDANLNVCEKRDPKGLYRKARKGEIKDFTGIDSPYEPPENPEIILKTDEMTVESCVEKIIDFLVLNKVMTNGKNL